MKLKKNAPSPPITYSVAYGEDGAIASVSIATAGMAIDVESGRAEVRGADMSIRRKGWTFGYYTMTLTPRHDDE